MEAAILCNSPLGESGLTIGEVTYTGKEYEYLGAALADANGFTVAVAAGEYYTSEPDAEGITVHAAITSSTVNIIGESADTTFISGNKYENAEADDGGAALFVSGKNTEVVIEKVSFSENEFVTGLWSACGGGALAVYGGKTTVKNSIFKSNNADLVGGAIAILYNSSCAITVDIADSEFSNNVANCRPKSDGVTEIKSYGGAIYLKKESLTLTNVNFFNNEAGTGGAVHCEGGTLIINGGTFANNKSVAPSQYGGGAICYYTGTGSVSNVLFLNNTSETSQDGGAVRAHGTTSGVTFTGCTFSGNVTRDSTGGAIYVAGSVATSHINISGCTFVTASDDIYAVRIVNFIEGEKTVLCASATASATGIYNVKGADLVFGNDTEINIAGLTFYAGENTGKASSLTFRGSETVNFLAADGQTLAGVNITINTDNFDLSAGSFTVAANVKDAGTISVTGKFADFVTIAPDENKNLVCALKEADISETSLIKIFTGGSVNLMSGGNVSSTFFAAREIPESKTVSTMITGGSVDGVMVGGAYADALVSAENTVEKVLLNISGGEFNNYVFCGGYLYGSSAKTDTVQMSVAEGITVNIDGGNFKSDVYAGIHTRDWGKSEVSKLTLNVSDGAFGTVFGGGWAQEGAETVIKDSVISISGGQINDLFAGGNNAATLKGYDPALSTVDEALITVSGSADINNIYLSGKYANSAISGTVTLNITGGSIGSVTGSYYGADSENKTKVNVGCNVAGTALENIDILTIAENFTFSGSFSNIDNVVFDLGEDGFGGEEWTALTGTALDEAFADTLFTVGDLDQLSLTELMDKGVVELSDDKTELTIIKAQLA